MKAINDGIEALVKSLEKLEDCKRELSTDGLLEEDLVDLGAEIEEGLHKIRQAKQTLDAHYS